MDDIKVGDVVQYEEVDGQTVEGQVVEITASGGSAFVEWFDGHAAGYIRTAVLKRARLSNNP